MWISGADAVVEMSYADITDDTDMEASYQKESKQSASSAPPHWQLSVALKLNNYI